MESGPHFLRAWIASWRMRCTAHPMTSQWSGRALLAIPSSAIVQNNQPHRTPPAGGCTSNSSKQETDLSCMNLQTL